MANRKNHVGGGYAQGIAGLPGCGWLLQDDEPGAVATPPANPATPAEPAAPSTPAPAAPPAQASPQALSAEDVNRIAGPLLQRVQQTVSEQVAPIQQANEELRNRLDELSRPQRQATPLFGGAPGVRVGEDPLTSRGYNVYRVIGFRQGAYNAEQCKVELDLHNRLYELFVNQGAMSPEGQNSILVPLSSDYIAGVDGATAVEVRQSMSQGVNGFDPDELRWLVQRATGVQRQALSQFDDTGLGILLGPTQHGDLIDLLRAREVFGRAGATQMALPPNGRLRFPKAAGATTAYWLNEVPSDASTPTITASEPSTGHLELIAKKLGVLTKLPNELLRFANPTVEAFVRNDMTRVMALAADLSMLEGAANGNRIKGLINYANIKSRNAGTLATDGNTLEPDDLGKMMSDVEQANHDIESQGWTWVMRPELNEQILNRRADAVSAADEKGAFLYPVNRGDVEAGRPTRLRGYQIVRSTQVSNTRTKGSGTDLTYLLGGIFAHWLVGRVGVMEFTTSTQGDTPFTTDQTWVKAIQHIDAGPRYETAFAFIDDLLRSI